MHKYVRIILDQKVIARIGYTEKGGYAVPEAAFYRMKVDEEESATGFKPHRLLYAFFSTHQNNPTLRSLRCLIEYGWYHMSEQMELTGCIIRKYLEPCVYDHTMIGDQKDFVKRTLDNRFTIMGSDKYVPFSDFKDGRLIQSDTKHWLDCEYLFNDLPTDILRDEFRKDD